MNAKKQFFLFLLCGGVAAVANIGSRCFFSLWMSYTVAITAAFLVGLLTGFVLFKFVVFNRAHSQSGPREVVFYIAVNGFALLQTMAISLLLARIVLPFLGIVRHAEDIAHVAGVVAPVITSYFFHKYLTFKS